METCTLSCAYPAHRVLARLGDVPLVIGARPIETDGTGGGQFARALESDLEQPPRISKDETVRSTDTRSGRLPLTMKKKEETNGGAGGVGNQHARRIRTSCRIIALSRARDQTEPQGRGGYHRESKPTSSAAHAIVSCRLGCRGEESAIFLLGDGGCR